MHARVLVGGFAAVVSLLALASPVLAHGDHDARPIARDIPAGPYTISLWQVYADASVSMTPHVIVMVADTTAAPLRAVQVAINGSEQMVHPSATTARAWETMDGVVTGDTLAVSISDGTDSWALDPVVVPAPPTSFLPMQELLYASIVLTAATGWWVARRTARAWRKPAVSPGSPEAT